MASIEVQAEIPFVSRMRRRGHEVPAITRWVGTNKRCMIISDGGADVSDGCIDLLARERIEGVSIAIGTGTPTVLQSPAAATGGDVVNADSLWKLDAILAHLA